MTKPASNSFKFNCPHCDATIRVKRTRAGHTAECPKCEQAIQIPAIKHPDENVYSIQAVESKPAVIKPVQLTPQEISPAPNVQVNVHNPTISNSFGISALILGILSMFTCWIWIVNIPLAGLGLVMGITAAIISSVRKGTGAGYAVAGSAVCGISLILGITFYLFLSGLFNAFDDTNDGAISKEEAIGPSKNGVMEEEEEERTDHMAAQAGRAIRLGDVSISVTKAFVGKVPLTNSLTETVSVSESERFVVFVELENTSNSRKIDYNGWMSDFASLSGINAVLTDDKGNKYKQISFSGFLEVTGTEASGSLYPGKTLTDAIVFEEPVDAAQRLTLTLSQKAFDKDGNFSFSIPRSFIQRNVSSKTVASTKNAAQSAMKDERSRFLNTSYNRVVVKQNGQWQELDQRTKKLLYRYRETKRNDEFIELHCLSRNIDIRLCEKQMEQKEGGRWKWVAHGGWDD